MQAGFADCLYIDSPAFDGNEAVMVVGNSMLPMIAPGQVVTFRQALEPPPDNTLAVIQARLLNGRTVRVLKCVRAIPNRRRWEWLELTSYNQSVRPDGSQMYPPYRLARERVIEIGPVVTIVFSRLTNEPAKGGDRPRLARTGRKEPAAQKSASGRLDVGTPL